jgi:asparagine synthase (glutamine-hydrolysing)
VAGWLRGPLAGLLDDLLSADRLKRQELFRPEVVGRLVAEHRSGSHNHRKPLWTLLMFQLWHRAWLECA